MVNVRVNGFAVCCHHPGISPTQKSRLLGQYFKTCTSADLKFGRGLDYANRRGQRIPFGTGRLGTQVILDNLDEMNIVNSLWSYVPGVPWRSVQSEPVIDGK